VNLDLGINAVLAVADAAILAVLWKRRDPKVFAGLVASGGFVSLILAAIAGDDMFGAMRVVAWAVFVHGVVVLAGGAVILWKSYQKTAIAAGTLALLTVLVGVDAFLLEPTQLQITRLKLPTAKLRKPLRIVILADIQTDVVGPYERAALEAARNEKPDLILFAGDYIQAHSEADRKRLNRELRAALKEAGLVGPRPAKAAVQGNCDAADWPEIFDGTGIAWTKETTMVREGDFQLTALSEEDSFNPRLKIGSSNLFDIVLGHSPDFALGDVQADLLVAGHTHGGQVRLPFIGPWITLSRVPRSWAAGVTKLEGGRTLVVSRGIGMERGRAPRLRFLCRPEIVVVDVVPAKAGQ
jgi:predicted MPP superfamily phosphohydrolase